jgi:hypothetical protein
VDVTNSVAGTLVDFANWLQQPAARAPILPEIAEDDSQLPMGAAWAEVTDPDAFEAWRPVSHLEIGVDALSVVGELAPAARVVAGGESAAEIAAEYRATFGTTLTNDYRATFFRANPDLEGQVVVHHAVPQRTLALYPDQVTASEIHSLENLRGVPKETNANVHLSDIAREWNQFYKANPYATRAQLLQKATEIDLEHGSRFKPPVGGGR